MAPATLQPMRPAQVAHVLARRLPAGAHVFCSPLQRCAALAAAVADRRPDVQTQVDGRLREMDFGAWEGRPWQEIARVEVEAWTADFAHHRPSGGESVACLLARVARALEQPASRRWWQDAPPCGSPMRG